MNELDTKRLLKLRSDAIKTLNAMKEYEDRLNEIAEKARKILPRGYWYSCTIDPNWHKPKKYSIRAVECRGDGIMVTIKEVFKKLPWPGFTGRHTYYLKDFLALNIYKTPEEAIDAYHHRICPKCGGFMMNSDQKWCMNCIINRQKIAEEFNAAHWFYESRTKHVVSVEYEDELTYCRGYNGMSFTIRRMDTNEIIRTSNLWSHGFGDNDNGYPEIEVIEGDLR